MAGLTRKETEVLYYLLVNRCEKTVKEISQDLNISLSKCYEFIKSLFGKGLIDLIDDRPMAARVKPIEEVIRRLVEFKKAEYDAVRREADELKKSIIGVNPSIEIITEIDAERLHRRLLDVLKNLKPESTIITYTPKSIIWSVPDNMITDPNVKAYKRLLWSKTTKESIEHKWIISLDHFIKRLELGYVTRDETLNRLIYFRDMLRKLPLNVKFVDIPLRNTVISFSITVYGNDVVSIALKAGSRKFNRGIIIRSNEFAGFFKDLLEYTFEKATMENLISYFSMVGLNKNNNVTSKFEEIQVMDKKTKDKYLRECILYRIESIIDKIKRI